MVSAISAARTSERQQTRPPLLQLTSASLSPAADAGPGASLLGEHHLSSLVDGDDGLDLIGDRAPAFDAAAFRRFGLAHDGCPVAEINGFSIF